MPWWSDFSFLASGLSLQLVNGPLGFHKCSCNLRLGQSSTFMQFHNSDKVRIDELTKYVFKLNGRELVLVHYLGVIQSGTNIFQKVSCADFAFCH